MVSRPSSGATRAPAGERRGVRGAGRSRIRDAFRRLPVSLPRAYLPGRRRRLRGLDGSRGARHGVPWPARATLRSLEAGCGAVRSRRTRSNPEESLGVRRGKARPAARWSGRTLAARGKTSLDVVKKGFSSSSLARSNGAGRLAAPRTQPFAARWGGSWSGAMAASRRLGRRQPCGVRELHLAGSGRPSSLTATGSGGVGAA